MGKVHAIRHLCKCAIGGEEKHVQGSKLAWKFIYIYVEISVRAIIQATYCVCWGLLQTCKDTIMRNRPLIYPRNNHVIPAHTASE